MLLRWTFRCRGVWGRVLLGLLVLLIGGRGATLGQTIFPFQAEDELGEGSPKTFDLKLVGDGPLNRPREQGEAEFLKEPADGRPCFLVKSQQAGMRIEEPAFLTPSSTIRWAWKKEAGSVCIVQVGLKNPETGQHRYLGYAAGTLSEPASADPTVEYFVAPEIPRQWTANQRNVYDDMHKLLGWESAQVTSFFLSPWDGQPGLFADATIANVAPADLQAARKQRELAALSRIGRGAYVPLRLKNPDERRVEKFETSFEECAPGRNSGANEWSAFGAIGNKDFNAMGRDLWVRYPAFELVFRLLGRGPGNRAGAIGKLPPGAGRQPAARDLGRLAARWSAVQGLGDDGPQPAVREFRSVQAADSESHGRAAAEQAVCRAGRTAGHAAGGRRRARSGRRRLSDRGRPVGSQAGDPRLRLVRQAGQGLRHRRRAGKDGAGHRPVPAGAGRPARGLSLPGRSRRRSTRSTWPRPRTSAATTSKNRRSPATWSSSTASKGASRKRSIGSIGSRRRTSRCASDSTARQDADGDGSIEVVAGVAAASRIRHTRLERDLRVPRRDSRRQPGVGLQRGAERQVPPPHQRRGHPGAGRREPDVRQERRELRPAAARLRRVDPAGPDEDLLAPRAARSTAAKPVSMGYIAHAFRDVLPGEAVPPFGPERVRALKDLDPQAAEQQVVDSWESFFAQAARFELPDPILNDIFLSRLATRAILDVNLDAELSYNACSPVLLFRSRLPRSGLRGLRPGSGRAARSRGASAARVLQGRQGRAQGADRLRRQAAATGHAAQRPVEHPAGPMGHAGAEHLGLGAALQAQRRSSVAGTDGVSVHQARGPMADPAPGTSTWPRSRIPSDPRYGLLEPGAMEVMEVGKGMHMYYLNGFAILGLREAADAARSLGADEDARLFAAECLDLKKCLHRSFEQTFKRTGLYEGHLWFGVEPEGVGMYGFWAHNCLVWPCRCIDPHDPMLTATWRRMESMSDLWGGGMHSEGQGSFWPYIGVDRAVSYLLRGEPDRTLDYFCAYDRHGRRNAQLGRRLRQPDRRRRPTALLGRRPVGQPVPPAVRVRGRLRRCGSRRPCSAAGTRVTRRCRSRACRPISANLDLTIQPEPQGRTIRYRIRLTPQGDQAARPLERLVLYPRIAGGRAIRSVSVDGQETRQFTRDAVILAAPQAWDRSQRASGGGRVVTCVKRTRVTPPACG